MVTCRLPDGREVGLGELPLAGLLEDAAPLRAEEVELSVPDGRSVRALINLTPIRSGEEEKLVSVVLTIQDLAAFEELERQRADFLRMVSHELRAPLASIKGSAGTVLEAPDASRAEMLEFFRLIDGQASHMRGLVANLLDAGSIEAGTLTVAPEPTGVASLVDRARTTFLSGGSRHPVLVDLPPGLPPAMADPERVAQVLNNLFSNAAQQAPSSPSATSATACPSRKAGGRDAEARWPRGRASPTIRVLRLQNCSTPDGSLDSFGVEDGRPGGIRTPDLRFRKPLLYPSELQARCWSERPAGKICRFLPVRGSYRAVRGLGKRFRGRRQVARPAAYDSDRAAAASRAPACMWRSSRFPSASKERGRGPARMARSLRSRASSR